MERTAISIEKRLEMAQRPKASSTEAAAAKVKAIGEISALRILYKSNDVNDIELLGQLTDDFTGMDEDGYTLYRTFCKTLDYCAFHPIRANIIMTEEKLKERHESFVTTDMYAGGINALVSMALIFIERSRDVKRGGALRMQMKMTLGDYLDALIDLSYTKDGLDKERVRRFRELKKHISEKYSTDLPLGEGLAHIVQNYVDAFRPLGETEHVIKCITAFDFYMGRVERERRAEELRKELEEKYRKAAAEKENKESGEAGNEAPVCGETDNRTDSCDESEDGFDTSNFLDGEFYEEDEYEDECGGVEFYEEDYDYFNYFDEYDYIDFDPDDAEDEKVEVYYGEYDKELIFNDNIVFKNPYGYFLWRAKELYLPICGNITTVSTPLRGLRWNPDKPGQSGIFMCNRNYDTELLLGIARDAKTDKDGFLKHMEIIASEERIKAAIDGVNETAYEIYRLLAEPYLDLDKYHYEKHLG